ncbi:MAG: helix-turn-helix domain-containing protein [Candidatus Omnitrophica bacterium]|nr:helix-turn-helix domain-containing protein [Candidatus Omnitrophota bacterium]
MADEKLLTVREVSLLLNISEKEVLNLAESGAIPAYKLGGVYLRFKREQVLGYQKSSHRPPSVKTPLQQKSTFADKLSDFFYFNDFYILAFLLTVLLLGILLRG